MALKTTHQIVTELFESVDTNRRGTISAIELQIAFKKGSLKELDSQSAKMMIAMFAKKSRGAVNLEEFRNLYDFQNKWQSTFSNQDDRGAVDKEGFVDALRSLGYNLSPEVITALIEKYDSRGKGKLTIDDFMKCAVLLNALDNSFRERDTEQGREITVAFEDLLTMVVTKILVK